MQNKYKLPSGFDTRPCKSLNELFGMSNEEYAKTSEDLALLCVDRLVTTGKLSHKVIAEYIIAEIRFKHFGEINAQVSQYEKDLFIGGMLMRFLLMPDVEKNIAVTAYAKQLENGLNGLDID